MDGFTEGAAGGHGTLPNTEPDTSVYLAEMGFSDTKADIVDETMSIVWAREWWRRWVAG